MVENTDLKDSDLFSIKLRQIVIQPRFNPQQLHIKGFQVEGDGILGSGELLTV